MFVAPSAYPLGGVQTWLDYLVPGLNERGWDAKVALASGVHHDVERYVAAHPALPVITVDNPTGSRQGRINAISRLITRERPDVAVCANIVDMYEGVGQARARDSTLNTIAVMSNHAIQPDFFEDVRSARELIDAVVCVNRLGCALIRSTGYPDDRIFYAPCGVSPGDADICSLVGSMPRPLRIAYVGRFDEWQKRILDLAPMCDRLAQRALPFELWIAGAGPDEQALRHSLATHESAGRIRWLGQVPADAVSERVYREIDVLINPSLWETGPIVVWEAMAHGVAVVSSRYIGSGLEAALVHGENCLLFDIGDASAAANAAERCANREFRAHLVTQASHLIGRRYTIGISVDEWDKVLRKSITMGRSSTKPKIDLPLPSGRLDRWLGAVAAERLRAMLARRFHHMSAGGEWPHSYGSTPAAEASFWERAWKMDFPNSDLPR
jgi:glycosyltransferase involved in cell wall biosynthesis